MNKNRNLIEVRGDTREAVFQVVGNNGKTETMKVIHSLLHLSKIC